LSTTLVHSVYWLIRGASQKHRRLTIFAPDVFWQPYRSQTAAGWPVARIIRWEGMRAGPKATHPGGVLFKTDAPLKAEVQQTFSAGVLASTSKGGFAAQQSCDRLKQKVDFLSLSASGAAQWDRGQMGEV
jgi:hypothetical protein